MDENAAQWEFIGRQLLHTELMRLAQDRLETAMFEVAEDIESGEDLTAEHLEHLGIAFYEVLYFIREFLVPLVDDPDEVRWEFKLTAQDEFSPRSESDEDTN